MTDILRLRCSKLDQYAACSASAVPPVSIVDYGDDEPARMGTAIHSVWTSRLNNLEPDIAGIAAALKLDEDELDKASGITWAAWRKFEEYGLFELPYTEWEFTPYDAAEGVLLTGTADVVSFPNMRLARFLDLKSGWLDRDCEQQLRGYGLLSRAEEVEAYVLRPRLGTIEKFAIWTKAELEHWFLDLVARIRGGANHYRPSPSACQFCARRLECPGRQALIQEARGLVNVALNSDLALTPRQARDIVEQARMLKKGCEEAIEFVKNEVRTDGGVFVDENGDGLEIVKTPVRSIKPAEGWDILEARLGDRLPEAVKIGLGAAENIVRQEAPPRKGAASIREMMADLDAAGAIEITYQEKLELVKPKKAIQESASA